jgi:hypothetical protein
MAKKWKNNKLEAEKPQVVEAASPAPAEEVVAKVDFDVWHTLRKGAIPKQHHKEILKADFKARGLSQEESMADFDTALGKYGVKLA